LSEGNNKGNYQTCSDYIMFDGYFCLFSIITLKEALQNRKWARTWYDLSHTHTDLSQLAVVTVKTLDLSFLVEWHKGSETLTQCQW